MPAIQVLQQFEHNQLDENKCSLGLLGSAVGALKACCNVGSVTFRAHASQLATDGVAGAICGDVQVQVQYNDQVAELHSCMYLKRTMLKIVHVLLCCCDQSAVVEELERHAIWKL